jgi:hypothetical protein
MIPTVIVEEHNEVFFVWHDAIRRSLLPSTGNALLHVDAHADISLPDLSVSLAKQNMTLEEIFYITYSELNIQNYLTASVYQEIFNEVVWLRPCKERGRSGRIFVWSEDGKGERLFMSASRPFIEIDDLKECGYYWLDFDKDYTPNGSVVLNIDLDFFTCGGKCSPALVEVTRTEYERYMNDRRHYLRFTLGSQVKPLIRDGRYYLALRLLDGAHISGIRKVPLEEAYGRIERLAIYLEENRLMPSLITVCRSVLSGYTPSDMCEQLQASLFEVLGKTYPLRVDHIDRIIESRSLG